MAANLPPEIGKILEGLFKKRLEQKMEIGSLNMWISTKPRPTAFPSSV